ncbi:uncharacterized protein V1510DRAFT_408764 [Dipodascopsis tothii]|uniref:uncharacterized protein n=1 Tax=Dipodascopsis tothii TaxID=44089 RepID=UPI0034CFF7F5
MRSLVMAHVVTPLVRALDMLDRPTRLMAKRDRRMADYRRFLAARDRGAADRSRAADTYVALNGLLVAELPVLLAAAAAMLDAAHANFVDIQTKFHAAVLRRLRDGSPFEHDSLLMDDIHMAFVLQYSSVVDRVQNALGIVSGELAEKLRTHPLLAPAPVPAPGLLKTSSAAFLRASPAATPSPDDDARVLKSKLSRATLASRTRRRPDPPQAAPQSASLPPTPKHMLFSPTPSEQDARTRASAPSSATSSPAL